MAKSPIEKRKAEHLRIVAEEEVTHSGGTLLGDVHLLHDALPELNLGDLDLSTPFFGKRLNAPLMITSMTGGAEVAGDLNRGLASVCGRLGIAFAVGSQRITLRHPEMTSDFAVREQLGDGVLLGNIGGVQLVEVETEEIAKLVDVLEADGLCVHLNAAQELVQAEGNVEFAGILEGIDRLLEALDGRVLVKETGAGLSPAALEKLRTIGVPYVDVAGSGGTSWTKVESLRETNGDLRPLGEALADWGVPTAFSVVAVREILGDNVGVVASGGIDNGLDVARALALGADIAGFARGALLPFLEGGEEALDKKLTGVIEELKRVVLLTGRKSPFELKTAPRVIDGRLREWLAAYGWDGKS